MKKIIIIKILFLTTFVFSQSKYDLAMQKGLENAKSVKNPSEFVSISAYFERIAEAEKQKWLPYYYAALYNHISGWDLKADKDKIAEKTLSLIEKAENIEINNSEILCLRQMMYVMQMTVDPMTRWATYGQKAKKSLEEAKAIDPNNPRIYFLEAQTIYNTPEQFGGGKKNAKPIFEKSVELFNQFIPKEDFYPDWGKEDAEKMLKECQ